MRPFTYSRAKTRAHVFHDASFRPASRHRVRLGAEHSGKIVAAIHEVDAQTSRHDLFPGEYAATSSRLHGFANFGGHERLVRTDVQTPGYMRARPSNTGQPEWARAPTEAAGR